jgi:hypothetical protein
MKSQEFANDPNWDRKIARLKKLAQADQLRTVWDPVRRVYRTEPTATNADQDQPSVDSLKESSGYVPSEAEKSDPRWSMALSVDVRPGEIARQANRLGLGVDSQGRPPLLKTRKKS